MYEHQKPTDLLVAADAYLEYYGHTAGNYDYVTKVIKGFDFMVDTALTHSLEQLEGRDAIVYQFPTPQRQFNFPPPEGA